MTTLAFNPPRSSGSRARSTGAVWGVVAALTLASGFSTAVHATPSPDSCRTDPCAATNGVRQARSATGSGTTAATRPFRGFLTGRSEIHPTSNPVIYTGSARAAGVGTHVGTFTKVTDDVVNVSNGWTMGSFTMTVASGAQVRGEYEGFVVIDLFTGTFSWVLDATITGGTGRFAHATGEFVFEASGEFVILPDGSVRTRYEETFDGTIEY